MLKKSKKKSASITLVLIGAAVSLGGCGETHERRDVYANQKDCVADWGDEKKCEQAPGTHSSGSHFYYGPRYYPGQFGSNTQTHSNGTTLAPRPNSKAIGSTHIARGGFGSSGRSGGG
jgi:uncharacterized protein YgiB involved in biofilm formation